MILCFPKWVRKKYLVNWSLGRIYVLHRWRINLRKIQGIVNISIILGGQELLSKVNEIFLHFSSLRRKYHVGRLLQAMGAVHTLFGNIVQSIYQAIQYVVIL